MAQKKYLDSVGLSRFLENIKSKFSEKNHTHTKSQITDFAHTHDDRYYTEPEIDKKVSALTDAISNSADTKVTQTAITDTSSYTNWRSLPIGLDSDTNEDTDPTTVTGNLYTTGNIKAQPSTGTIKATTFKGNLEGNAVASSLADNAKKLSTPRKLMTKLDAADAASFDGSADVKTIGVTGKLPIVNGGTGADSISGFKTNIGLNPVTTSGTGAAYTADVNGITSLKAGVNFVMIPHTVSTQRNPTLNVNGLGAKLLKMRLSSYTSATTSFKAANSLAANKPVHVMYDGTQWVIDGYVYPDAKGLYGAVPVSGGGTGATTAEEARQNLGITTANGTMLSQNADYAEVGEWADDNPSDEDRIGYFVAIDNSSTGATMVKATSTSDVRGVTVVSPAFSGNCSDDKFDIVTSTETDPDTGETITKITSKKLKKQYDYVAIMGIVSVIDNGTCEINGRCMPAEDGTAVPSPNNMGYQIIDRIDDTHVLVAVSPEVDMMVRIRTDVVDLQKNKADAAHNHDGRYYTESEIDSKVASINSAIAGKASSSHKHAAADITSVNASAITGIIPAANLPSFVDDVLEGYYGSDGVFYKNYDTSTKKYSDAYTGETDKIYVNLNDNKNYRWSGSAYVVVSETIALGETSSTAYRGDRGKVAYDHSQKTGNPHGTTKADLGLGNVENKSSATIRGELTKANITTALGYTPPTTNTTYSTGSTTYSGTTKLYTGTGTNTDGTMTQNAITTALNGKASSGHNHDGVYVPTTTAGTNAAINRLGTGTDIPVDDDYYVSQWAGYASSEAEKARFIRRPVSALWSYIKSKADSVYATKSHSHSYAGSSSSGGSANSAVKLDTSAGSTTQPVYFSGGKPVAIPYTIGKSVPSNAVFTDTTYGIGSSTTAGLTKLYTGTGSATDGTMTQSAITSALSGKANNHSHPYLPTVGGTMSGNITFASVGDKAKAAGLSWGGSTDGASIYYETRAADEGHLVLNMIDDSNLTVDIAAGGTVKSYFDYGGTFHGSVAGNASSASSVPWSGITGKPSTYTPSSHTHDDRYYTESEINSKLSGKANTSHTHTKSQITDFPSSMPASDVYSWAKQSSKPSYKVSVNVSSNGDATFSVS